jgi:hypothetical protein
MIIKDLLPQSYKKEIQDALLGDLFPWYLNKNIIPNIEKSSCQFTHTFYRNNQIESDAFNLIKPMIYFIEDKTNTSFKTIQRIKANLRTKTINNDYELNIHKDMDQDNYKSFLYYLNDSDGDTLFFDKNKKIINSVTPKENSGIFFKSNISHTSQAPIKNDFRVVINFIFET